MKQTSTVSQGSVGQSRRQEKELPRQILSLPPTTDGVGKTGASAMRQTGREWSGLSSPRLPPPIGRGPRAAEALNRRRASWRLDGRLRTPRALASPGRPKTYYYHTSPRPVSFSQLPLLPSRPLPYDVPTTAPASRFIHGPCTTRSLFCSHPLKPCSPVPPSLLSSSPPLRLVRIFSLLPSWAILLNAFPFTAAFAADCTRTYTVKEGDWCDTISAANNVSTYVPLPPWHPLLPLILPVTATSSRP